MKLTTKIKISFKEWMSQMQRFADYEYPLIESRLPNDLKKLIAENKAEDGFAEIKLNIKSLCYPRFEAVVEYVQNWNTFINVPTFDDAGEANGSENITQPNRKVILSYRLKMTYEEIESTLEAVEPLIDQSLEGKERLEAKMIKAMELDVLSHYTFVTDEYPNGLPAEQYTKSY